MGIWEPYAVFLQHANNNLEGSLRIYNVIVTRIVTGYWMTEGRKFCDVVYIMLILGDSFVLLLFQIYNPCLFGTIRCASNGKPTSTYLPILFQQGSFFPEPALYTHGVDPNFQGKDEGPGVLG